MWSGCKLSIFLPPPPLSDKQRRNGTTERYRAELERLHVAAAVLGDPARRMAYDVLRASALMMVSRGGRRDGHFPNSLLPIFPLVFLFIHNDQRS